MSRLCSEPGGWVKRLLLSNTRRVSLLYLGKEKALIMGSNAHPAAHHPTTGVPINWTIVRELICVRCLMPRLLPRCAMC